MNFAGKNIIRQFASAYEKLRMASSLNHSEFKKFCEYYRNELYKKYMRDYLDIFTEYFSNYLEFNQTMFYVLHEIEYPQNYIASSVGFDKVKMFYGNAYEIATSHLLVPECLNNIAQGRPYDVFVKMQLKKYNMLNKANRVKSIGKYQEYLILTKCVTAQRN